MATDDEWMARANIQRFERLMKSESDPQKVRILRQLLSEEKKKLDSGPTL